MQVFDPWTHDTVAAEQLLAAVVQLPGDTEKVPLLQVALALPVVGATLSVNVVEALFAVAAAVAVHVELPTVQDSDWEAQPTGAVVEQAAEETVNAPLEQLAVAVPVSGPVVSARLAALPLPVAGAVAVHVELPTVQDKACDVQFTGVAQVEPA